MKVVAEGGVRGLAFAATGSSGCLGLVCVCGRGGVRAYAWVGEWVSRWVGG